MGVHFYEQVPEYRWDIPITKRLRNRFFKLKWTQTQFVDYLSVTVLAKVECDVLGWSNYAGFRSPTSCPRCNEFDAEVQLLPMHLTFVANLAPIYSARFIGFSEFVSQAVRAVSDSTWTTITEGEDPIVRTSRAATWSEQEIHNFLRHAMEDYQTIAQGKGIRTVPPESFASIEGRLVKLHGCDHPDCGRFEFVSWHSVIAYFDYLEDGFSFIKLTCASPIAETVIQIGLLLQGSCRLLYVEHK